MNWSLVELQERLKNNPALKIRQSELEKLPADPDAGTIIKKRSASGWREDLQQYFRSSWEANYARYLNFIKEPWEYEKQEWEFPVKRGNRFYKCDFYLPGKDEYHELKGYMDKESRTKLNRMAKYYTEIKIIVIGKEEYKEIAKFKNLIPDWESVESAVK
jgi:hypothetical protein